MRPVLSVDLICAERALMKARPNDRRYVSRLLILRANIADYHREQLVWHTLSLAMGHWQTLRGCSV